MKTFKSPSGPFVEQPYYTANDVEAICSDELLKLGFYPSDPSPVRIDRFIEKRFDLQPTYEDLPNGLLGFTRFGTKGVEEIVITTALDEEGTRPAERRLRTTLAHEGGHGLLHAHQPAEIALRDALLPLGVDIRQRPPIVPRQAAILEDRIEVTQPQSRHVVNQVADIEQSFVFLADFFR